MLTHDFSLDECSIGSEKLDLQNIGVMEFEFYGVLRAFELR